jgi:hypothetical protein
LHWAASNDDLEVAVALIDGGADLETPGGSIGTPLDNAIGYGCWNVARLLVERGARVDQMWHAGALGMLTRLRGVDDRHSGSRGNLEGVLATPVPVPNAAPPSTCSRRAQI